MCVRVCSYVYYYIIVVVEEFVVVTLTVRRRVGCVIVDCNCDARWYGGTIW